MYAYAVPQLKQLLRVGLVILEQLQGTARKDPVLFITKEMYTNVLVILILLSNAYALENMKEDASIYPQVLFLGTDGPGTSSVPSTS
nr:hypothetical protein [Tanacetum cinerariifolium]